MGLQPPHLSLPTKIKVSSFIFQSSQFAAKSERVETEVSNSPDVSGGRGGMDTVLCRSL